MSITNYFGKPRAKYAPYKSPYTFDNLPNAYGGTTNVGIRRPGAGAYGGDLPLVEDVNMTPFEGWPSYLPRINNRDHHSIIYGGTKNPDVFHNHFNHEQYKLGNIQHMFNDVLIKCMEWVAIPFWTINKIVPAISMVQILIFKIADMDKRIDHLEKMVASLCEDNTLLSNRIKALEQSLTLLSKQKHIPVAELVEEHITVAEAVLAHSLPK